MNDQPQPHEDPVAEVRSLICTLGLQPHPEGGYYREIHRADATVAYRGRLRSALTSIQYLLSGADYSAWHRIDADEVWSFHAGAVLALHAWDARGNVMTTTLVGDPRSHPGARFQAVVPAGAWFAAELLPAASPAARWPNPVPFALVGCVVAPGFEFAGFELAGEADMAPAVRTHGDWVRRLLKAPPSA